MHNKAHFMRCATLAAAIGLGAIVGTVTAQQTQLTADAVPVARPLTLPASFPGEDFFDQDLPGASRTDDQLVPAGPAAQDMIRITLPTKVNTAARKIHLVLFSLTEDHIGLIGPGVIANHSFLKSMYTEMVKSNPSRKMPIEEVYGPNFTSQKVSSVLERIASSVTPDDAVVVYFSTHGDYDQQRKLHILYGFEGVVLRNEVLSKIQQAKPRLAVLITDTCTTPRTAPFTPESAPSEQYPWPLLDLLLYYKGAVNISSSTPPEASYYIPTTDKSGGGLFTRAFCRASVNARFRADELGESKGWDYFMKDIKNRIDLERKGKDQNPVFFPIP